MNLIEKANKMVGSLREAADALDVDEGPIKHNSELEAGRVALSRALSDAMNVTAEDLENALLDEDDEQIAKEYDEGLTLLKAFVKFADGLFTARMTDELVDALRAYDRSLN